jgi:lipopolysaccharide/colanic/teichoic acid biosynthesis glycosyltransferase
MWKKIMDPMLDAVQRGEKLSEKEVKKQKRILDIYFSSVWIMMTFVQFFIIGVKMPEF